MAQSNTAFNAMLNDTLARMRRLQNLSNYAMLGWRCKYCGRNNGMERDECKSCGAPQPRLNLDTGETK